MSNIRVELQLADGSFTSGMLRAGQSLQQFNQELIRTTPRLAGIASGTGSIVVGMNKAEGATKGFLGTLRDVSIVTGLVSMGIGAMSNVANGFVGQIVKVNAEMERLRFQMQAMSTAKDPLADANRSVAYLRQQAKNMPFAMGTITNAFVKLKTTGMDPMNGSLTALADGIAAFGGDDQAFNRVVLGITQMSGKSVIQMEEMRQQLGESMPAAMQVMARSMGVSIAELTQAISTGRVAAQPALQSFFEELQRSYGGEAQRMMQTFSGQVSQLYTNLQNLATNEGGRGFFDQVKGQLVEINDFLQSGAADKFATRLGQGLSTAIGWVRQTINVLFEMRHVIQDLAVAGVAAFAGLAITRGISSLASGLGTLRASFVAVGVQAQAAAAAQSFYTLTVNSGAPALVRLTAGLRAVSLGMAAVATGFMAAAPWIAAVGVAVYTTGNYFGWFSNKVRESYEELKNYGAESRAQAEQISKDYERQLEARLIRLRSAGRMSSSAKDAQIKELEAELAAVRGERGDLLLQGSEAEDKRQASILQRRVDAAVGLVRARYREEQAAAEQHFNELAKKEAEAGKTAVKVEEDRKARILQIQQTLSRSLLDIYKKEEDDLKKRRETALGDDLRRVNAMLSNVRAMWLQENENLKQLQTPGGVEFTTKPINDDANIKQGRQNLDGLRADIEKVKAELGGASGAAAEMWFKIKSGDYGQIEGATAETKKLHEELLAAAREKEALDNLLRGQKKAEGDLASLKEKVLNKEFELRKKMRGEGDMSDSEEFLLKLQEGFYPGLGPIDNIREAVNAVTSALDLQGTTLNEIGNVSRNNTFGDQTAQKIQTVTDKLRDLNDVLGQIARGVTGIDFSSMGNTLPTIPGSTGGAIQGVSGFANAPAVFDRNAVSGAITYANQNATRNQKLSPELSAALTEVVTKLGLAVSVFSGGQDATGPNRVGSHRHDHGNAADVFFSKDGRRLDWSNAADLPMFQDIVRAARAAGITGIGAGPGYMQKGSMHLGFGAPGVWGAGGSSMTAPKWLKDAFNSVSGPTRQAAAPAPARMPVPEVPVYNSEATQQRQLQLMEDRIAKTNELMAAGRELANREANADEGMNEVKRKEALETILAKTKELATQTDKLGKTEERYVNAITKGDLGKSRDPKSKEYEKILAAAREQDRIEKEIGDKTRAGNEATRERTRLEEEREKLIRQIAEQEKLASNPDYKPESSQLQNLRKQLDSYVDAVRDAEGENSAAYKAAVDYRSQYLTLGLQRDALTNRAATNAQTRELQTGLLSQTQQRQVMMQRELAELDRRMQQELQIVGQTEAQKLQITEDYEAAKAAVRAKYAQEASPLSKQMTEWRDMQSQLAQASSRWMDSLAGGITDLIMGTGDLRSVIQGILKDIVNMGVKYMMSGMFQGKGGSQGGKKGSALPAGAGKGGKAVGGKMPLFHTGGIIGSSSQPTKFASAAAFMNAPKFHTGGIIGGPKLLPSEVPIIAKKGEGVFTPEQMAGMGGFSQNQQFNFDSPITVNGSAGTPEQNTDLAQKMAREYQQAMRGMIAEEFRKQARPGNFMNNRSN